MIKTSSYHDSLVESLADPVEAKHYLKAVLEDYPEGFLKALRNVAQAHQMKKVAEAAGVKRESLYRALSEQGNPTWDTLNGVLGALGFKFSITTTEKEEPAAPLPAATPVTVSSVGAEMRAQEVTLYSIFLHAPNLIAHSRHKRQIGMMEATDPIRPQIPLPPLIGERNAYIQ